MAEKRVEDALTALLRTADPAAREPGLDPAQRTVMRRRMLAAGRQRRSRPNGWLVPVTAAMGLLVLALGLALRQQRAVPAARVSADLPIHGSASTGQQIQFTTDNGTLVVWVLQPRPARPRSASKEPRS